MSSENLVSRRGFIQKSALLSAGVVAGSTILTSCSAQSKAESEMSWDKEADVVVVGSGTVAVAAVAAASAGAKVILLEKGPMFGGTTSLSGGGMWIPNNYIMAENNIDDSKEDARKYIQSVAEGQTTDELIDAFLDKAPEMLEFLRDTMGAEFTCATTNSAFQDYYNLPGMREYGRTVNIMAEEPGINGGHLMSAIKTTLEDLGVEILIETAGDKLVTDSSGAVIGIIASDGGNDIAIKANKGVILGTGGFDFNKDMTKHFLRGPIYVSVAVRTNTGDGHIMGMEIGADLRNMNESWGLPSFLLEEETLKGEVDWQMYRGKPGAIVVNKFGERIGNEACPYEQFQRSFYYYDSGRFEWRNTPSFCIFDGSFLEHYPLPGSNYQVGVIPEWMVQADTLEELAEKLGIDWEGFNATLETFNANAREGIDPAWRRGESAFDVYTGGDVSREDLANPCLAPLENGPFLGVPYYPGTCGTCGGLRVNGNAQVLNVRGEVIPGLYAAGNTMGGVFGASYPGGGSTLGQGMTFGYIAGKDAVERNISE